MNHQHAKHCPHALVDYQYGTWHKCRGCGAWVERIEAVAGRGAKGDVMVPFSLMKYPARSHAANMRRKSEESQ